MIRYPASRITEHDLLVGTWTSPSDFGDLIGKLTPDRWFHGTEYGTLAEWKVTKEGSFINGLQGAETTLDMLGLHIASRSASVSK
jgi:predicted transcriptional regulator